MTDEPTSNPQNLPPKLSLRPPVPPPASPVEPAGVDLEAPTIILKKTPANAEKKKTSRIALDDALQSRINAAMNVTAAGDAPKSINLPRPSGERSAVPTVSLIRPTVPDASSKSMTSRIALETVLPPGGKNLTLADEPADDGSPAIGVKTIRLRRPGEATTPRMSMAPSEAPISAAAPEDGSSAKSRTARLDTPATTRSEADSGPPTQRKTIRIKRPTDSSAAKPARTLSLARGSASAAISETAKREATPASGLPPEAASERDPGPVFALVAVAAALVATVLLYVLIVQAFPGADLSWPGQIRL